MRLRDKYKKIEDKEIPDDYTNHFYSHFGFHDHNYMKGSGLRKYYKEDLL